MSIVKYGDVESVGLKAPGLHSIGWWGGDGTSPPDVASSRDSIKTDVTSRNQIRYLLSACFEMGVT